MESGTITLLKGAGKQGILLAELAQQLSQSENALLKVIDSLSEKGQVQKVEEMHDGKSVIRVVWQNQEALEWDTLHGCPCFICSDINQCGEGQPTSPWNCNKLNAWIKERID